MPRSRSRSRDRRSSHSTTTSSSDRRDKKRSRSRSRDRKPKDSNKDRRDHSSNSSSKGNGSNSGGNDKKTIDDRGSDKRRRSRSRSRSPRDKSKRSRRSRSRSADRSSKKSSSSSSKNSNGNSRSSKSKKSRSRSRSRSRDGSPVAAASSSSLSKSELKAKRRASETKEERAARRAAKKLEKAAIKAKEKELFGYSDEANPFGDQNLTQTFVWKKKNEKDVSEGKAVNLSKAAIRDKQLLLRKEIEQVKQRRSERESEMAAMEEMREQQARDYATDVVDGWEAKEEEFHLKQAQLRSEIRIKEGREKAIDILAKNVHLYHANHTDANIHVDLDVELTEPYKIFDGLHISDLEDLRRDIKIQLQFGTDVPYWDSLLTICDDEIRKTKTHSSVHDIKPEVAARIDTILAGRTVDALDRLRDDADAKIHGRSSTGEAVDIPFWEALIKQLVMYRARAYLREFHQELLKKRLLQLREQHKREMDALPRNDAKHDDRNDHDHGNNGNGGDDDDFEPALHDEKSSSSNNNTDDGSFSPTLVRDSDDLEAIAIDPDQDRRDLEARRRQVLSAKADEETRVTDDIESRRRHAADDISPAQAMADAGMNRFAVVPTAPLRGENHFEDDEVKFGDEVSVPATQYLWHDKYRPRKPRYFNRVKTGYEWNKYNQTHYDKETPPPKIVQGYKFNIFYPDLIDPKKPPVYRIEPCTDASSVDYCIIRFTAGPPYEDIAFKIVKKEWEYNHKHGYKSVWDRGVLHLYFNFKRYRYRR